LIRTEYWRRHSTLDLTFIDWEKTNPINSHDNPTDPMNNNQHAAAQVVASDPSIFQQNIKYESQPNIFVHRPPTPVKPRNDEPRYVSERVD
jgi:hypothetical protein